MSRNRLVAVVAAIAIVAVAVPVVLSTLGGNTRCGDAERAIESSNIHVFDAEQVRFDLSPPTSGPHILPAPPGGVSSEAIIEPRQVSALETGMVIVQYDGLDAAGVADLEALASSEVIVMPSARPIDDDATVALTAWGVRQLCTEVDIEVAETFIAERVGAFFVNHDAE